jgi:ketosteroid isomerase-like protein
MKYDLIKMVGAFLLCLILLPASSLLAQDAQDKESAKLLEGYTQDFARAYSAIPETKDKEAVLKYFSKKFQSTIFYFSIAENVRMQNSNYDGFAKYLDNLMRNDQMSVKYEIQDIIRNHVNGDVATLVAIVDYEIQEADGFHAKGTETVTFAWKKVNGVWQILHFTVMGIEDEKLRGTCLCEVFSARNGDYVVRTTVPSGRSYSTSFNEFETRKSGEDTFIKTKDNAMFKMTADGEVWRQDGTNTSIDKMSEVQRLGKAGGEKGAILLIIKNHIYPDKCTSIKYND